MPPCVSHLRACASTGFLARPCHCGRSLWTATQIASPWGGDPSLDAQDQHHRRFLIAARPCAQACADHPADCRRPYEHQLEEQDNAPSILRFGRARTVLSSHDPRVDEARHIMQSCFQAQRSHRPAGAVSLGASARSSVSSSHRCSLQGLSTGPSGSPRDDSRTGPHACPVAGSTAGNAHMPRSPV